MPDRLCFTGSRDVGGRHLIRLYGVLEQLHDALEYWTGGAPGIDQAITRYFIEHCPEAHHGVIIPRLGPSTVSHHGFALELHEGVEAGRLPPTIEIIYTELSPMARNPMILGRGDFLHGFPRHPEQTALRSGTWRTIALARQIQMPHCVWPLEG